MSYKVDALPNFEKEAKKLIKKYASLKNELGELISELQIHPTKGTDLGNNIYKIRLAIASKGKGKSGGARIITFVKIIDEKVYLVSIYDKNRIDDVSKKEIIKLLKNVGLF